MSEYQIIAARPEFQEQILELRRSAYETEFADAPEYMAWKYGQNPYIGEPILYLALDAGGNVAGMRGCYGTRWRTAGGPVVIPCADDFAIARAHRNKGLMTAIMRFALEDLARRGYDYVLNTSGGRVTVLQSLAMGWKSVGAMEPMTRTGWRRRVQDSLRPRVRGRRVLWRLAHVSNELRHGDERVFERLDRSGHTTTRSGLRIASEKHARAEAMAELAARLPYDGRIRGLHDAAFFAWRCRNPSREYRFVYAERDGRLEGYLLLARSRSYREPKLPFNVADWEGSDAGLRAELLHHALSRGGAKDIGVWTGTLGSEDRATLKRFGFRPSLLDQQARGMPCVLLKKLVPGGEWSLGGTPAVDRSHWDVRLIDSMHG
ncbi:MAG: GNAT family N-acetyltransferase [Candidatus Krumholzibacteria bacterium]|nr:GNAT family N-acetyltransferase [Candidatus Krumholzibacteria bacterium]MDH4337411.1 GNAT family N-acetyltransferase [Candidatus Krumholzibacteria bacterium]MDH5270904.1 GNAT family N-acetyltransferase [Candidatus Krumholzibacteria bacterium]MDH5626698.1 GNAT family N-acetyltransferase [Candidatus Krumholzibacteria bacterium]